ncbi:MAG TPA: glycosyltransferase [Terriglobales bacterium]|jgi:spore maturation protein CgeB
MTQRYSVRLFAHSLVSDWNHGNAHFLRGLVKELVRRGHNVRCYEELGSWSLTNLVKNEGERAIEAIDQFRLVYPMIDVQFYRRDEGFSEFLDRELQDADVVIIHEWNDPAMVNEVLAKKAGMGFKALFHDTHHRASSALNEILKFHLHLFDGVLAFGEAVRKIYQDGLGIERVWTFHEAADADHFKPMRMEQDIDVCWVGNWGDDERTSELEEFLIRPTEELQLRTVVHGVRYPQAALERLARAGVEFCGYLPNLRAPEMYSRSAISLHVPRRQYADRLAGVPTIRVFEALACGAPLLCAPWEDSEGLFRKEDYVIAANGEAMKAEINHYLQDESARRQLGANGRETVLARHTCGHRADQLVEIMGELS